MYENIKTPLVAAPKGVSKIPPGVHLQTLGAQLLVVNCILEHSGKHVRTHQNTIGSCARRCVKDICPKHILADISSYQSCLRFRGTAWGSRNVEVHIVISIKGGCLQSTLLHKYQVTSRAPVAGCILGALFTLFFTPFGPSY